MKAYTHPNALQRVCEELERIVWPVDRAFAQAHRDRQYWVRPAEDIEVTQQELYGEKAPPQCGGHRWYVLIYAAAPGCRLRHIFSAPDIGEEWRTLDEEFCRQLCATHWPDSLRQQLTDDLRTKGVGK